MNDQEAIAEVERLARAAGRCVRVCMLIQNLSVIAINQRRDDPEFRAMAIRDLEEAIDLISPREPDLSKQGAKTP